MATVQDHRRLHRRIRRMVDDMAAQWLGTHPAPGVGIHRSLLSGCDIRITISDSLVGSRDYNMSSDEELMEDEAGTDARMQHLRFRIAEFIRLVAREIVLRRHPAEPRPAWSYRVPRMLRDLLAASGTDPAAILTGDLHSGIDPEPVSDIMGDLRTLHGVGTVDDRMYGIMCLHDGTADLQIKSGQDGDTCRIVLPRITLPETAMSCIAGLRLSQVIAHAAFEGVPDERIIRVRTTPDGRGTELTIECDFVWLRDEAPGIDLSWQKIHDGRMMPLA